MQNEIEISHVTKAYGKLVAVKDFSLAVPRGTVFGLLGPNGAGKTTLVSILTTLLKPTQGTASVGGHNVVRDGARVRGLIGVVPRKTTWTAISPPGESGPSCQDAPDEPCGLQPED